MPFSPAPVTSTPGEGETVTLDAQGFTIIGDRPPFRDSVEVLPDGRIQVSHEIIYEGVVYVIGSAVRNLAAAALFALVSLWAHDVSAATLTVCATGCTYDNTQLQTAINAATPGDVILLQQNFSYVGAFVLRKKTCAAQDATCYIEIRTGVTSTAGVISVGSFPATDVRILPAQSNLAVLVPNGNNVAAIRTTYPGETGATCAVAPCVASWWKLRWLRFNPHSYGGSNLLSLGSNDTSGGLPGADTQDNKSEEPHHFIVDQCLFEGHPVTGQERAMLIAARDVSVTNSYIRDIKAISDKQGIWSDNSTGNITLTNNYVEGSGENVMFGGDTPRMNTDTTVLASPAPTTTTFALADIKDYLTVGQGLSVVISGVPRYTHLVSFGSGTTITVEALPSAPATGALVNYSVVPKNITVTKNYFAKPVAWRNPIMSSPSSVSANGSTTGGTLAAGTYSYKVVARVTTAGNQVASSTASVEVPGTVDSGTTGSVSISWGAVTGATSYYIYGRSSGGQNIRWSVTAPTVTFTDTGASGTTENVPTSTGKVYMVKNLFELKKAHTVLIEGNVFDYSWESGQTGYALLFTVLNNSTGTNGNDSTVVRDVTFRNNKVRHAAAAMQLSGVAADGDISDRTQNITIFNNIFEDLGTAWGSKQNTFILGTGTNAAYTGTGMRGTKNVLFDHNTVLNAQGKSAFVFDLYKAGEQHESENLDVTNNMFRRVDYGLRNLGSAGMEAEGAVSWASGTDASSSWSNNVMVGASCALYPGAPASSWCPSEAVFQAAFVNYASGNYRLANTWTTASTTGNAVGANIDAIEAFTSIALSGDNSGGIAPPTPPTITTSVVPNATKSVAFTLTFTASNGTTPYVWTLASGTLPPGLSLSSGGVLSGLPSTSGNYTFTVRVTSAAGAATTQTYSQLVIEILEPASRPDRVDYVEIGIFRRETAPDVTDAVRVGDLWYDLTTGLLNKATSTAPAIVWESAAVADLTALNATNLTSGTVPNARFPATLPAASGANLTALSATQLTTGTVPDARFPATLPVASGASLTALNATQLTSGTVPDARFPATLPAASGANLTALAAGNISTGTVATARLGSGTASSSTYLRGDQTWATPSGGSGGQVNLTFSAVTTAYTNWSMTTTPNEMFGAARTRIAADLTNMTQCRVYYRVGTTQSGAGAWVEYTADGTNWFDLGTSTHTPALDFSSSPTVSLSSWTNIAAGAKAEVFLRVWGVAGGSVTPTLGNVGLYCK